jgi:N-formylglutamate deformylase
MPSKGTSYHADPSAARSDVVPGDALGKSCDARLTAAAVESCAVAGLSCKPNDPYTGGGITQAFGRPADRVHSLQIEMNRRLYMDEESFEVDEAGLARLQSFAREFLDRAVRLKL